MSTDDPERTDPGLWAFLWIAATTGLAAYFFYRSSWLGAGLLGEEPRSDRRHAGDREAIKGALVAVGGPLLALLFVRRRWIVGVALFFGLIAGAVLLRNA